MDEDTVLKPKLEDPSRWHIVFVTGNEDYSNATKYRACKDWCYKQFGGDIDIISNRDGVWTSRWAGPDKFNYYRFHFQNSEDAVMFALRWSGNIG